MPAAATTETVQMLRDRITAMQKTGLGVRTLPTDAGIAGVLPGGALKAGVAYAAASLDLAMLLAAGPSAAGAWCGVVGVPEFGVEAAAGLGIDLGRLVLVPEPGEHWLTVTAQLVDVLPVVLVRPTVRPTDGDVARLASRLRQHGAVLIVLGAWPQAEAALEIESSTWLGLGSGHGTLTGREAHLAVRAKGTQERFLVRISDDFLAGGRVPVQPIALGRLEAV